MEIVVTAIVLDREPVREYDELVHLYTREFGYLVVRAVSSRKINSKFSAHIDPLTRVQARIVHGQSLTLTDIVPENRFQNIRDNRAEYANTLKIFSFIKKFFPRESGSDQMWGVLNTSLEEGKIITKSFLSSLGFDARHAVCTNCDKQKATRFYTGAQTFFCSTCSSKMPVGEVLYID
jgi:DNA repair protein RecO